MTCGVIYLCCLQLIRFSFEMTTTNDTPASDRGLQFHVCTSEYRVQYRPDASIGIGEFLI